MRIQAAILWEQGKPLSVEEAELGAPGAIDADTVFQLASVSKPLTATVIAGITTRMAVELVSSALQGGPQPPERTVIEAQSYPSLDSLEKTGMRGKK